MLYWLRIDILSLAGPEWSERMELIDFIIEELELREDKAHQGIRKLRIALDNQKEDLLAFAQILDQKLADIAHKFKISLSQVRQVCLLRKESLYTNVYWLQMESTLPATFRSIFASEGSGGISDEIDPSELVL